MKINQKDTLEKKMNILDEARDDKNIFQILEIERLEGANNMTLAQKLFFAQQTGLKAKMVRILLNNSLVKTEAGALYYHIGNIECCTNVGGGFGFVKKVISGSVTNESAIKPQYKGTGEIWLEPSFKHYIIMELSNETFIIDKNMFYCCSDGIEVSAYIQKNLSALIGGDGIFQLEIKGTGVVILESITPSDEIVKYDLEDGEILKVDGNFAIARSKNVNFTVTKSSKSLIGSAMNGEGLLNTFTGPGQVWLAPTAPIYSKLDSQLSDLIIQNKSRNSLER